MGRGQRRHAVAGAPSFLPAMTESQNRTRTTQHKRDGQRAHQEPSTQVKGGLAQRQMKALVHFYLSQSKPTSDC